MVLTAMDAQEGSDAVSPQYPESRFVSPPYGTLRAWADTARERHFGEFAALILEALGPLALVISQILHTGEPVLGGGVGRLARFLESESSMTGLVEYLTSGERERPALEKGDA